MLIIVFSWLLLFVVTFLIGKLFLNKKTLGFLKFNEKPEWYEYFWIGFAIILAILQIWSIFFPTNIYSLIFIVVLSIVSIFYLIKDRIKIPKINIYHLLVIGVVFFVVAYFSSLSVYWPDTQGYHLNAVKWANLYPVVPGLANLHSRLGFNSSFFLFASMVDSVLKDRSSHIALSFMTSMLLTEYIWLLIKSKNQSLKIFLLLTLPVSVVNIIRTGQISSLSYDFALLILILAVCIELIRNNKISLFTAGVVSIILLTVKLSGVAFSLAAICYVFYELYIKNKKSIHILFVSTGIGILFVVPYIVRNVILTGWPFYPLPIFGINFIWKVPLDNVKILFETIKAWAILPGESYSKMIGVPVLKWLPGWISRNANSFELRSFMLSLITLVLSSVFRFINIDKIKRNVGLFMILTTSFIGILYLVISAPDFRFGGIFFWIFFASSMSLFFTQLFNRYPKLQKVYFVLPVLLIYYIAWPPKFEGEIMLKSIHWEQTWTFDKVTITPSDGSTPFEVYIPGETGSCGNSKLPCTPEYKSDFKEIVPGDISKGFAPVK